MKKVLIITYHFPPRRTVGSLRLLGLAKYLPEFGWETIILTATLPSRPDPQFKVLEAQYHDSLGPLKRLFKIDSEQNLMSQIAQLKEIMKMRAEKSLLDLILTAIGEVSAYPDPQKGWRHSAVRTGEDILRQESIDVMISSSPPATSHIIAKELKEKYKVPWVAEFRDLWTQNYYYRYSPLRKMIERMLELNTLRWADVLVTASTPLAIELGELHGQKPVYSITNGFDPAEVNSTGEGVTNKFTITYTGNLYPSKQSPEPLFMALRDLISQESINASDIEVRFYGSKVGWVDKQAERCGLTSIVKQFGIVPREIVLSKQRESQLLLLLKWNDPKQRGAYSTKTFEYLAAKRPILAVGGFHDVVNELLDETKAGICASTIEDIKRVVKELYREYKLKGIITYKGEKSEVYKYSYREIARKFVLVLDKLA
ncbi:glycosyltransferase [Chloroflexota bacterium]